MTSIKNIEEFQEFVKENLVSYLPDELKDATIESRNVTKNNGITLHAIEVTQKNSNVAPMLYLESFFNSLETQSIDGVMENIATAIAESTPAELDGVVEKFQDFDFVRNHVIMVAVNTERNSELLSNIPHYDKEDLSLIYKVMLGNIYGSLATITIRNEHMQFWGVTAEEIHEIALANTKKLLPATIQSMNDVLSRMIPKDKLPEDLKVVLFDDIPANQQMYVITNNNMINGATTIFYDDALENLSKKLGTDLYIMPSSIHEVIAVSTDMGTPEALSEMVKEVNSSQVAEEEQLSDNVYYYSAETNDWTLAV